MTLRGLRMPLCFNHTICYWRLRVGSLNIGVPGGLLVLDARLTHGTLHKLGKLCYFNRIGTAGQWSRHEEE